MAPLWQQDAKARLFLVVLDGCSYPVFLELLHALAQDNVFPLGLRPDAEGRVAGLPALAPLPTVTSHARGAIFLGRAAPRSPGGRDSLPRTGRGRRPTRPASTRNASLGHRNRRLFLKSDLADGGQALLTALGDATLDVVAAVFNAVDDQSDPPTRAPPFAWLPRTSRPSSRACRPPRGPGAASSSRPITATAPSWPPACARGAGGAARFAVMEKTSFPPDGFLEIDVAGLGGPPARRAFAWQGGSYMGSPQVGFHGGCSLEEMVVPLAWLEREGLQADEPAWWYGGGALDETRQYPAPVAPPFVTPVPSDEIEPSRQKPRAARATAEAAQLSFFDPAPRVDVVGLPEAVLSSLGKDEKAVLVLLHDNGSARTSELAGQLGKTPARMNGLMRNAATVPARFGARAIHR